MKTNQLLKPKDKILFLDVFILGSLLSGFILGMGYGLPKGLLIGIPGGLTAGTLMAYFADRVQARRKSRNPHSPLMK